MIPRTVLMAQNVAAQFTTPELENYGNIILNGYATTGPNSTGKLAWQYKETATAPVPLPAVTTVQPALKGWTTNYAEYYTQLPPNAYGVNPGDPTMFEYTVHSFTPAFGTISSIGNLQGGAAYPLGSYTNLPAIGGQGSGATLDVVTGADNSIITATLNNPGSGYAVGDGLTVTLGSGYGFAVQVVTIAATSPAGLPKWSQPLHRLINAQVAPFVPPNANQQAIQYSGILYPVADNPVAPPIDEL